MLGLPNEDQRPPLKVLADLGDGCVRQHVHIAHKHDNARARAQDDVCEKTQMYGSSKPCNGGFSKQG